MAITRPLSEADLTDQQKRVLTEPGDLVVVGRPGSGKTSVAILKAMRFLQAAADPDVRVLFLSFSNAAVQRIQAATRLAAIPRPIQRRFEVTTFHAFCHQVLSSHARLAGMPRLAGIVLRNEDKIIKAEAADPKAELSRLEREEGRCSFDRLMEQTVEVFRRNTALRAAYARAYPLILVDEYQDTNDLQDELVDLIGKPGQVIYLGDPDQRIYDFVPGVRHDRLDRRLGKPGVTRIDLEQLSHRSGGADLVAYGRAVLTAQPLSSKCKTVSVFRYGNADSFSKKLRQAILCAEQAVRRAAPSSDPPSIAILGFRNSFVAALSTELDLVKGGFDYPFVHRVHAGAEEVGPAWTFVFKLLSLANAADACGVLTEALHQQGRFERAQTGGIHQQASEALLAAAGSYRQGTRVAARSLAGLDAKLENVSRTFCGDPRKDIESVIAMLRANGSTHLSGVLSALRLRSPAEAGPDLISKLTESYAENGYYRGSSSTAEAFLLRERLLEAESVGKGRLITTLHKVKGKEFDAVVIVDGRGDGDRLLLRNDGSQEKSRRLLNVAITRARHHAVILTPVYDSCCLLPSQPVPENVETTVPAR